MIGGSGFVLGDVGVGGPVEGDLGGGTQPGGDVVEQSDRAEHLVAVEGRVVVIERPERAAVDVLKGIAVERVHGAVGVLVGGGLQAFPAAWPAVEQAFVEVAVRLADFGGVEAVVVEVGEGHIGFDLVRHVEEGAYVDGGLSQVAVVDDGVGTRVGERHADASEVAGILQRDVVVHRMAVVVQHAEVVGLGIVFPDHAIPPKHALAVHWRTPALGGAIVAEGGVGGFACRTLIDAVDARIFIHLVAVLVGQAFDGGKGRGVEGDRAAGAVFVLHLAVEVGLGDLVGGGVADAQSALLAAFLGGDEHHAVAAS